ncbi:MAG: FkbM family methyltransferase [Phaeodactylibacter sp.]|nr:FkbM family methyltransferase [Phaeodactylibacter sp.]MCB9292788.1 FkbM family methyltransferase [Lewinellaceae bacterium]
MIDQIKYTYRAYRFRYKIDPDEINYLRANLKKGDVAVDIGAHKGGYLYWMRKGVGKEGKVFAFEPQKKLFDYLQSIARQENVVIEHMGVSSEEGEATFFTPKTKKGDSPGARIGRLAGDGQYDETKIRVTTLDKYFLEREICPTLIKIDVEGHEGQVLRGGTRLLKTCRPRIVMECENRHLKEGSVFDVFNILLESGYQGFFFQDKKLRPLNEFKAETHQKSGEGRFWEAPGYINNFIFENHQ